MGKKISIASAPDIRISFEVAGEGPLLILMHGWPELGLSWRHQVAPLVEAGFRVAVPDMRGYGDSSHPFEPGLYTLDALADDMAAIARSLGAAKWIAVGHDWGAPVAWRCALRFPEEVAGVFCLSVPHAPSSPMASVESFELAWPDSFYYVRYFQEQGVAEAEFEADIRASLKKIYYVLSGDAPKYEWIKHRPKDAPMLPGLADPPAGALSFMSDEELDRYAAAYARTGFAPPINWYRNLDASAEQGRAYGDEVIRQPSAFLYGDKEIVLGMVPGALERQRPVLANCRGEIAIPDAGHWIQQERPDEVNRALIAFARDVFG
ncbi:MAG: alpha/beta hydrolase [Novosphingobium sp.]|nr:alpha/beta hydrolase [Novosphingobium sp.]